MSHLATFAPTIPPATQARLAQPAAPGQRHAQIVQIAAALIGQGFNTEAVFWQIRPNYGADVPDSEIRSVIAWAANRIRISDTSGAPRGSERYGNYGKGRKSDACRKSGICGGYGESGKYGKYGIYGNRPFPHPLRPYLPQTSATVSRNGYRANAAFPVSGLPQRAAFPLPQTPVITAPFPQNASHLPQISQARVSANALPQNTAIGYETVSVPVSANATAYSALNRSGSGVFSGFAPANATARSGIVTANGYAIDTVNARISGTATDTANAPVTAIERFLSGFRCEECDLWERSPIRPAENWETDALTVITALFRSGERANIVSRFSANNGKAHPVGFGITQTREAWISAINRNGPPQSAAGVWIRPNPTDGNGVSDANVMAYRFLLVEFDAIPLLLQTAFLARLPLPIAAIMTSGGKSLHAWIALNAANATDYRTLAARIFATLEPFGIDTANRNPARLSRLPGVIREIGSVSGTDNRQRLLYLNPEPKAERIIA